LGKWRIDAEAYLEDILAGTGSQSFTVMPGDNSVLIPMEMNGGYFDITLDPSIPNGLVSPNFAAAFPGTKVALTVTPGSDYILKAGSLKYSYGGSNYTPDGSGPYTFTLPASDVTVSADFIQFVRYVRAGGAGSKDGTSWANASDDLQKMMDALAAIPSSDYTGPRIVKVAAGTYTPLYEPMVPSSAAGPYGYNAPGDNRDKAFILRQGVQVWGGYPASGGDDASRNIATNETILSGDIGAPNVNSDNAYHVVLAMGVDRKTVLNGLTITGGNANGSSYIQIFGYIVNRNNGGGMYTGVNTSHSYSPVLVNVKISGNNASNQGGGMYNYKAKSVLVNVLVSGNAASNVGGLGGGMLNVTYSSLFFINVTVSGNYAGNNGGGMHNDNSTVTIRNSVIWGNDNNGVNGTTTISNSIVQNGWSGVGNLGGNPVDAPSFVDAIPPSATPNSGGDYRLNGGPAVNTGDSDSYPDTWDKWQTLIGAGEGIADEDDYNMYIAPHLGKDLAGAVRIRGTAIDRGAYERE
jgi:hypothetical protein